MGTLKIERVGGFAGYGLPGSKLQSRGEKAISALSADDKATVEAMFAGASRHDLAADKTRDGFRYRITRNVDGKDQTVEMPEASVPASLKACVTDTLK